VIRSIAFDLRVPEGFSEADEQSLYEDVRAVIAMRGYEPLGYGAETDLAKQEEVA
jgi:hypothetical protein